jgi:hypothetical protein
LIKVDLSAQRPQYSSPDLIVVKFGVIATVISDSPSQLAFACFESAGCSVGSTISCSATPLSKRRQVLQQTADDKSFLMQLMEGGLTSFGWHSHPNAECEKERLPRVLCVAGPLVGFALLVREVFFDRHLALDATTP